MRSNLLLIVLLPVLTMIFTCYTEALAQRIVKSPPRAGTAIIMTGAAAKIPQQAALLEELYERGLLKDVVFISGVSAGALNAVILNAILSGKLTWDEYRSILFSLENKDIFINTEGRKLPVNTESMQKLLKKIVEDRLGYYTIGDLPYFTEISFTSRFRMNVYRMCSRKINRETDTTLNLVNIMMASSAIPFAFPPVKIQNVKTIPNVDFIDGGVGSDYIPFKALLDFQNHRGVAVERVYIVGKKMGTFTDIDEELKLLGVENKRNLDNIGTAFDNFLKKHLLNRLEAFARAAPDLIYRTFVWIPDFEQDFLMFNFGKMEEQYGITKSWAQVNDPVPLGDFLLYNKVRLKEGR